jgi:hypothetical protein
MTGHQIRAIDDEIAAEIRRLHKRHPRLGHHGIFELLEQAGTHVDREDLERFMAENHIRAAKPWRLWRWRGASWPFGSG